MSMDLRLTAWREAVSAGGKHYIVEAFTLLNIPTEDSLIISEAPNIRDMYGKYIKMNYHNAKEHLKALDSFLTTHDGWIIEWFIQ